MLDDNVNMDMDMPVYLNLINSSFGGASSHKDHKDFAFKISAHLRENRGERERAPLSACFPSVSITPSSSHPLISAFLSRERNRGFSSHKSFMGVVKGEHVQSALLNSHWRSLYPPERRGVQSAKEPSLTLTYFEFRVLSCFISPLLILPCDSG